jgi:hypothetical protein
MKIKIWNVLQAPLILFSIISFGASIYVAAAQPELGIGYGAGIFLGLLLVLYFIGSFLRIKKNKKKEVK